MKTCYNKLHKFQCIAKLQKQCNLVISSKLAQKVFFLQEDDKLLQSVNKLDWVIITKIGHTDYTECFSNTFLHH